MRLSAGLLLSLLLNSCSPKLGTYCTRDNWTSETIQLQSFHRFHYRFYGETIDINGFGTYQSKGDSLTLNFKGYDDDIQKLKKKEEKNQQPSSYFGNVHLRIIDQLDQSPISFARIVVIQNGNPIHIQMSDENGNCDLSIAPTTVPTVIKISMQEYAEYTFEHNFNQSPFITIELSKKYITQKRVPNDRIVYYIDHQNGRKELRLKDYKEGESIIFTKFD